jgi:hypothetical protein
MLTRFANQRLLIEQTAYGLTRLALATARQEGLFCATFFRDPRF